jgi:hypothetical protein
MHEEKRDVSMANCEPICNYVRQAKLVHVKQIALAMRRGRAGRPVALAALPASPVFQRRLKFPVGAIAIFLRTFTNV